MNTCVLLRLLFACTTMTVSASAQLTLAPLFADHAVLQRDKPLPIWGRASAGEKIEVKFRELSANATADADGRWMVLLPAQPANSDSAELTISGKKLTIVLHDIVVGDVWLASGQSNMEWTVAGLREEEKKTAAVELPLVRQLKIERVVATTPAETVATSGWKAATPATVGDFSAVGYFFARDLQRKLGVPIGIVNSSWGGTAIESWMSDATRAASPLGATLEARWQQAMSEWPPERVARYPQDMAAWQQAEEAAKANKTKNLIPWPPPPASLDSPALPGGLFNAMIAPLQPGALRGFLWYQGESNVERAAEYAELFPAMIRAWRANWGDDTLPFFFVQLPNYAGGDARGRAWARFREAQMRALELPATGMAVAIDVGDPEDIHPKSKMELARRLALLAKLQVYGIAGDAVSPLFDRAIREGATMRVFLKHAGAGLVSHNRPVQSLEIAGPDRVFHAATGRIDRDTLIISSPRVKEPVAVRYAWSNAPAANLYSGSGLPVTPFRSDNW